MTTQAQQASIPALQGRATWLVKVEGVDSVEEAESLRGHTLHMLADDRPALEGDDEFYVQELVGMQVLFSTSHTPLPLPSSLSPKSSEDSRSSDFPGVAVRQKCPAG